MERVDKVGSSSSEDQESSQGKGKGRRDAQGVEAPRDWGLPGGRSVAHTKVSTREPPPLPLQEERSASPPGQDATHAIPKGDAEKRKEKNYKRWQSRKRNRQGQATEDTGSAPQAAVRAVETQAAKKTLNQKRAQRRRKAREARE